MISRPIKREDYGVVLDFLPTGHTLGRDRKPLVQVIGTDYFTLLEAVVKEGETLKPGDKVYIGPEKRDKIHHVLGRIHISKLTNFARQELENSIKKLVEEKEEQFVTFFNKAAGINIRLHEFEILPGIGKKHMWHLLDARKEKEFTSLNDIKERATLIPDPKKVIIKRILLEMEGNDRYKLFTF